MREIKQLTRSEFQVMSILWNLPEQSAFTGEILEKYENPKPAYTTLATFLKILTNKGFVRCRKKQSKLHFKAAISEMEYAKIYFAPAKDVFFKGSFIEMMRFILQNEQPAQKEIDELRTLLDEIQKQ
jgi:predicted transcriptional regulator